MIQTTTQAIRESSNALNTNLIKSIKEGLQEYDEITNRKNLNLTNLVNSNTVNSSIVKTVSNLLKDKTRSQFNLEPVDSSSNLFTINHTTPQLVQIKGSTMTFEKVNTYILNDPDSDKLVDQIKLPYLEKVGGNDNPMLSEQIIAIADKLLQYQCITPSDNQNMRSTQSASGGFGMQNLFGIILVRKVH